MAAEGVELIADVEDLAVMGFIEVLSRLPFFLRLRKQVFSTLRSEGVDLVIPIDYPGFNLRLARHARAEGRRVLYYIAPQVWAWHASRAKDLARDTDKVAVILPFEEDFLRAQGADAEFVGHPLLDLPQGRDDRITWCRAAGIDPDRPLLALMPGSRVQEVARHLPVFSAAASAVQQHRSDTQVLVGAPTVLGDDQYLTSQYATTRQTAELLRYATAAIVKSGTTTLEAALFGTPFVVAYRMNPITYQLARRLVRVPHIALANLVAGSRIVPEFVQEEVTAAGLAASVLPLLAEGDSERDRMIAGLGEVRSKLGRGGAAERVAEIAAALLGAARA
jgi:lipid-A-disaccharide synthase